MIYDSLIFYTSDTQYVFSIREVYILFKKYIKLYRMLSGFCISIGFIFFGQTGVSRLDSCRIRPKTIRYIAMTKRTKSAVDCFVPLMQQES